MKIEKKSSNASLICPICGDTMKDFNYAYDNKQYGKNYYKCDTCGHKECIIK